MSCIYDHSYRTTTWYGIYDIFYAKKADPNPLLPNRETTAYTPTETIPKSTASVGWYSHGPRPGEAGSAVIDGRSSY